MSLDREIRRTVIIVTLTAIAGILGAFLFLPGCVRKAVTNGEDDARSAGHGAYVDGDDGGP